MSSGKEKNFKRYIKDYPEELINEPNGILYCRICSYKVNYLQKSNVEHHLKTTKHVKGKDINNNKDINNIEVPTNIYCIDCIYISWAVNSVLIENSIKVIFCQFRNSNKVV